MDLFAYVRYGEYEVYKVEWLTVLFVGAVWVQEEKLDVLRK